MNQSMAGPLFLSLFLVAGMLLSGCIILVPVPLPVPSPSPLSAEAAVPAQAGPGDPWWGVTPSGTPIQVRPAATPAAETPAPVPAAVPDGTTAGPAPSPAFAKVLARDAPFDYTDNDDFHAVSVSVGGSRLLTGFYYTPGGSGNQLTRREPATGDRFLMAGVDFHMTGIRREGKSSQFMTPLAASFRLVKGGESYGAVNASDLEGMTDYYIRDVGSMYHDRFITKDDDGDGFLIFEVPVSFDPAGALVSFCPQNDPAWASSGYYRSPDSWDCARKTVAWQLR
jgi:hypothetical protein